VAVVDAGVEVVRGEVVAAVVPTEVEVLAEVVGTTPGEMELLDEAPVPPLGLVPRQVVTVPAATLMAPEKPCAPVESLTAREYEPTGKSAIHM